MQEFPLHQAILNDDIAAVKQLAQDKLLLRARNALGLTALEVAQFLDKKQVLNILQPRSITFKLVKKNEKQRREYSQSEFEQEFGVHYLSHLKFPSYDFLKEAVKNCPWTLRKGFWGEENRELGITYEKELLDGYTADLVIKWIDDIFGYGAFAATDVEGGAYIGEYTGLVRRLYRSHPDHNGYCFHYPTRFWSWKYLIVDALKEGNVLRFVNHSDMPNLEPLCLVRHGILHLVFCAKTAIKQGTQLTFDYGTDYWRRRHKI